jgi:hypothetical protein
MPFSSGKTADLHVTLGASIIENPAHIWDVVQHDVRMVKAALLYADRITLVSSQTATTFELIRLDWDSLTREQQREALVEYFRSERGARYVDPVIADSVRTDLDKYLRLTSRSRIALSRKQRQHVQMFERYLDGQRETMSNYYRTRAEQTGITELADLQRRGLLEIYKFEHDLEDHEACAYEFADTLIAAIESLSSYLMFDDDAAAVIRERLAELETMPTEQSIVRARETGFAADLLDRLPNLENATVSEIVQLRDELRAPLTRFRAAMVAFSKREGAEPWTEDFLREAESVFRSEVAPSVEELDQKLHDTGFVTELFNRLTSTGLPGSGVSAIGVGLTPASEFYKAILFAATLGVVTIASARLAFRDYKEKLAAIQRTEMYFFYKASRELGRNKKRSS